jgi:hypothetical protein
VRRADNLTTLMRRLSRNLGVATPWSPKGLSRPVMGLLYPTYHGCVPQNPSSVGGYSPPYNFTQLNTRYSQSQWPRGLRRGSEAARLLGLRVQIPRGAWLSVSCEYWVLLSGTGPCDGMVTRP